MALLVLLFTVATILLVGAAMGCRGGPTSPGVSPFRLLDDRGLSHTVPLLVGRGNDVMRWVDRHCSLCLLMDA